MSLRCVVVLFALAAFLPACTSQSTGPLVEPPNAGLYERVLDTAGVLLDSVSIFGFYGFSPPRSQAKHTPVLTRLSGVDTFGFRVYQNFPNPFWVDTYMRFSIPRYADVRITIKDRLDDSVRYTYFETLFPGLYQLYLNIVDSLKLRNGPYTYTVEANAGAGIRYRDSKQLFVVSTLGTPNAVSNAFGYYYYFDARHALVGDTVWQSYTGEDIFPIRLTNFTSLMVMRRGYRSVMLWVDVYPTVLIQRDIVLRKEE
ncbi:MAG: hypothetical protein C4326_12325 [Ignavibacteria bacterium]